jgi:DNA-binding CsgD family transcriptional regulator
VSADCGAIRRHEWCQPTGRVGRPRRGPRAGVAARYAKALSDDDAGALDAVSLELQSLGDLLAAADAAAQASTSHRRAGRKGSALTSSARARLIAKDCGGAVSPALSAALVPLPFTAREHEVAALLSGGLSSREIATAMAVSVRTVEGHIYQARPKPGSARVPSCPRSCGTSSNSRPTRRPAEDARHGFREPDDSPTAFRERAPEIGVIPARW